MNPTDDERVTRNGYTNVPNQILDNPLPAIVGTSAAWLYLILLRYENEGVAWPSWRKLLKQTGFCKQTLDTALKSLKSHGLIKSVDRRGGPKNTNRYYLAIPTFDDDAGLKIRPVQKLDQSKKQTTDGLKNGLPMVQKLDLTSTIVQIPGTNTPIPPQGDSEKDDSLPENSPPSKKTSKRKSKALSLAPYSDDFLRFWSTYPRKTGKGKAWEKYQIAAENDVLPPIDELVSIVERHAETDKWTKDGGQFIPHPATWLYQRCWEDELDAKPRVVKPQYTRDY